MHFYCQNYCFLFAWAHKGSPQGRPNRAKWSLRGPFLVEEAQIKEWLDLIKGETKANNYTGIANPRQFHKQRTLHRRQFRDSPTLD
jgi:hypothetical protein